MLGLEGWAYNNQPGINSDLLYRCRVGSDHFVTTSSICEEATGATLNGPLGWTVSPSGGV